MKRIRRLRRLSLMVSVLLLFSTFGWTASADAGGGDPVSFSTVVNGVTIPLNVSTFRVGNYYTKSGGECNHEADGYDNCKYYTVPGWDIGSQCLGFAMDVFYRINGFDVSDDREEGHMTYCATDSAFIHFMKGIPVGSLVRMHLCGKADSEKHAFILMRADDTHIYAYHCNWYLHCEVSITRWTYAGFYEKFDRVNFYVEACSHTVLHSNSYTSQAHYGTCTSCGTANISASHVWRTNAQGLLYCSVCGYQNGNGIMSNEEETETE